MSGSHVAAFAETRDGTLTGAAGEVASTAVRLAGELDREARASVLAPEGPGGLEALGEYGVAEVLHGSHDAFASYNPEQWTAGFVELLRLDEPSVVLLPATALGKDLAPRVAATLGVPLIGDVTRIEVRNGALIATRPVFAGKALAEVRIDARPAVITLRPNVFSAERTAAGPAKVIVVTPSLSQPRMRTIERRTGGGELDVTEASTVVSGGRGMKGPEHWHLLEALRDALGGGATLGASRAVVDAGWRPHAEQVGQTGKTVSPKLYVAVGISGAIQHLAGMRSASTIVAVNRDPDAPIFRVADYGIVGDAFEVLPALSRAIAELKAGD